MIHHCESVEDAVKYATKIHSIVTENGAGALHFHTFSTIFICFRSTWRGFDYLSPTLSYNFRESGLA